MSLWDTIDELLDDKNVTSTTNSTTATTATTATTTSNKYLSDNFFNEDELDQNELLGIYDVEESLIEEKQKDINKDESIIDDDAQNADKSEKLESKTEINNDTSISNDLNIKQATGDLDEVNQNTKLSEQGEEDLDKKQRLNLWSERQTKVEGNFEQTNNFINTNKTRIKPHQNQRQQCSLSQKNKQFSHLNKQNNFRPNKQIPVKNQSSQDDGLLPLPFPSQNNLQHHKQTLVHQIPSNQLQPNILIHNQMISSAMHQQQKQTFFNNHPLPPAQTALPLHPQFHNQIPLNDQHNPLFNHQINQLNQHNNMINYQQSQQQAHIYNQYPHQNPLQHQLPSIQNQFQQFSQIYQSSQMMLPQNNNMQSFLPVTNHQPTPIQINQIPPNQSCYQQQPNKPQITNQLKQIKPTNVYINPSFISKQQQQFQSPREQQQQQVANELKMKTVRSRKDLDLLLEKRLAEELKNSNEENEIEDEKKIVKTVDSKNKSTDQHSKPQGSIKRKSSELNLKSSKIDNNKLQQSPPTKISKNEENENFNSNKMIVIDDPDYAKKLEEQKRKREEILRLKEEKRNQRIKEMSEAVTTKKENLSVNSTSVKPNSIIQTTPRMVKTISSSTVSSTSPASSSNKRLIIQNLSLNTNNNSN